MAAKKILVAEDDPVTARFLCSLLEEKGYEVVLAEDGEQACRLAVDARPDLILTDLAMPYRDGFEVVKTLRDDPRSAGVPVIFVSLRDREEDIVKGLESGADDYVVKPFNARELLARVRKQLDGKVRA
jgi:DNA-binding response OmpR family regulator